MQQTATLDVHPFMLEPPPQQEYPSEQEAEAAIHAWTKGHKYNVSRLKTAKNNEGKVRYRLFACDQAGKLKNTRKIENADRKRPMRRSKRTGCPMRISIVTVDDTNPTGPWRILYTKDGSKMHNHAASGDVRVHVAHRQRAARQAKVAGMSIKDLIDLQTQAGVSTAKIHATMLLNDASAFVIPKDISNAKSAARSDLLATKTSNEALFELLQQKSFHYSYDTDPDTNRLRYLLWAHPDTTRMARDFTDLLILDCTYKTNGFHMPLLNAIILTGMNTILPFAQVWLPGESEPDFTWTLKQLKVLMVENDIPLPRLIATDRDLACTNATETVFPLADKLLCRWHIRRNVLAQTKKKIGTVENTLAVDVFMAKFDATIDAATEEEFNEGCAVLRRLSFEMAIYLDRNWWPYEEKIANCWTNNYIHFGCRDTSTVEGTHATMKSWLDNSQGDLLRVFQALLPWLMKQASNNS